MTKALSRRHSLLAIGAACGAPAIVAPPAGAQTILPDKAVRLVLGFSHGSGSDLLAQVIAPRLERRLGRRVSIDYRPGATGVTAGEYIAKAAPDGAIIGFMPSLTLAARLSSKAFPFNPERDLTALTVAGTFQMAIAVSAKIGVSTFAEYARWVAAGLAGRARFGATVEESFLQIFGMLIGQEIGTSLESVPYPNTAALIHDLQDGRIPAGAGVATSFLEYHRGGTIKMIATSGRSRMSVAKDVPTATELGHPKLEMEEWYGFFAPPRTNPAIVAEWNKQLRGVLGDSTVMTELAQLGLEVQATTTEEAKAQVTSYLQQWRKRLESVGMTPVN